MLTAPHDSAHAPVGVARCDAAVAIQRRVAPDHGLHTVALFLRCTLAQQRIAHRHMRVALHAREQSASVPITQVVEGVDVGVIVRATVFAPFLNVLAGELGQHGGLNALVVTVLGCLSGGQLASTLNAVLGAMPVEGVCPGAVQKLAVPVRGRNSGSIAPDRTGMRPEATLEMGNLGHHARVYACLLRRAHQMGRGIRPVFQCAFGRFWSRRSCTAWRRCRRRHWRSCTTWRRCRRRHWRSCTAWRRHDSLAWTGPGRHCDVLARSHLGSIERAALQVGLLLAQLARRLLQIFRPVAREEPAVFGLLGVALKLCGAPVQIAPDAGRPLARQLGHLLRDGGLAFGHHLGGAPGLFFALVRIARL